MEKKKKTDVFKRVYKSECTVQDDIVSFRDYNVVHAYGIDMLATAKDRKLIAYFVRENDEEMIRSFDNVGKLQMKLNVLSDVLKKNNETQDELYSQIKDIKEELSNIKKQKEDYRIKILQLLRELKKEDEMNDYYTEEEKKAFETKNQTVLEDDDINDIINKNKI